MPAALALSKGLLLLAIQRENSLSKHLQQHFFFFYLLKRHIAFIFLFFFWYKIQGRSLSDGMIPAPCNIPAAAPLVVEGETQIL